MAKKFEADVEDLQLALKTGREIRSHGPYGVLVGDDQMEFRPLVIADPVPTGRQVLEAAGVRDTLQYLLFSITQNGLLQELGPDQTVDLRNAGVERFLVFRNDRSFRFELDEHVIEWGANCISGQTLKKLAAVDPAAFDVWFDMRGGKDRQIGDSELFDLSAPGAERFYTKLREITVKVNTRPHQIHTKTLTFEQIVKLAFADAATTDTRVYTVTFKRGPAINSEGTLVEGGSVHIKEGMLFNVTFTDKS